jgi:hypothetical protein
MTVRVEREFPAAGKSKVERRELAARSKVEDEQYE